MTNFFHFISGDRLQSCRSSSSSVVTSTMEGLLVSSTSSSSSSSHPHVHHHHHRHTLSEDSTCTGDSIAPPPTLSRLPPDGHEFPPDYRDPASSSNVVYQVRTEERNSFFRRSGLIFFRQNESALGTPVYTESCESVNDATQKKV